MCAIHILVGVEHGGYGFIRFQIKINTNINQCIIWYAVHNDTKQKQAIKFAYCDPNLKSKPNNK